MLLSIIANNFSIEILLKIIVSALHKLAFKKDKLDNFVYLLHFNENILEHNFFFHITHFFLQFHNIGSENINLHLCILKKSTPRPTVHRGLKCHFSGHFHLARHLIAL